MELIIPEKNIHKNSLGHLARVWSVAVAVVVVVIFLLSKPYNFPSLPCFL